MVCNQTVQIADQPTGFRRDDRDFVTGFDAVDRHASAAAMRLEQDKLRVIIGHFWDGSPRDEFCLHYTQSMSNFAGRHSEEIVRTRECSIRKRDIP